MIEVEQATDRSAETTKLLFEAARQEPIEIFSPEAPQYEMMHSEFQHPGWVLILVPHYDDDVEFTGGIVQMLLEKNIPVVYAPFTDGSEGEGPYSRKKKYTKNQLVSKRQEENRDAISLLGDNNPLLYLADDIPLEPDMQLARNYPRVVNTLQGLIEKYTEKFGSLPGYMIGPHTRDYHPDHNALGKAMLQVAEKMDITALTHDKQFGRNYSLGDNAYQTGDDFQLEENIDDFFRRVQPGDVYEPGITVKIPPVKQWKKMRALQEYESQMYEQPFLSLIAKSNRKRGRWIGAQAAEAYDVGHQGRFKNPLSATLPYGSVFRKTKESKGEIIPIQQRVAA